ncbi:MAG TPA: hypothetical protein VE175_11745 [Woeseiaceae bacterium]|jgi:hypothetical protein|nr:hypothetical protein [Woeseiaceae bacterium]
MSWHSIIGLLFICCAGSASAEGYIVALGAETDTDDSRSFSAFGELSTGENTWVSAGAAGSRTDGPDGRFDAIYADARLDHLFDPVGIRLAAAYWGDPDVLDSVDLRASIYIRKERWSLSGDFERRDYDLVIGPPLIRASRTIGFGANGLGFAGRLKTSDRVSAYLGGMWYDYSGTVSAESRITDLRYLSLTRLILAHGLLDSKAHAGVEVELGEKSLDFRYSIWRGFADHGRIDSLGIGYVMPLSASTDLELRLSRDDSDTFGDSTVFSIYLYFFGA